MLKSAHKTDTNWHEMQGTSLRAVNGGERQWASKQEPSKKKKKTHVVATTMTSNCKFNYGEIVLFSYPFTDEIFLPGRVFACVCHYSRSASLVECWVHPPMPFLPCLSGLFVYVRHIVSAFIMYFCHIERNEYNCMIAIEERPAPQINSWGRRWAPRRA